MFVSSGRNRVNASQKLRDPEGAESFLFLVIWKLM